LVCGYAAATRYSPRGGRRRRRRCSRSDIREAAYFMFLFFSNRLGCLGSLLVSAVLTLILLVILGVL
jgi:hypothetical protein